MIERLKFSAEPAVWIGAVVTALLAVQDELADGSLDWAVLIPVLVGVITRFFVAPAEDPGFK